MQSSSASQLATVWYERLFILIRDSGDALCAKALVSCWVTRVSDESVMLWFPVMETCAAGLLR